MASIVQLKRSALSGKVPGTGSLNLGELAVNTYDGKIYFKKSGSIESVESVLTTNSVVTGSIRLEGTASFGSLKVNDTLTVNHGVSVISGSLGITSDLTVLGQINARQFNISVISSSVLFESGSSKFGNTSDDIHSFTGSVNITGSFLLNGQAVGGGTTTGSFTGSFTGDGSGLRGVITDDIPRDGWDYQSNSSASISDFNNVSDKYYIDFEQSQSTAVGTPIGFKGFLSNVSGSSQILPTLNSIDFVVGNNLVASIGVNGITATAAAGTVSGSSQLTSSYDSRYVLSGSITQTTWDNIASKPSGIVSGSSQLTASVLATTGSNTFRGTQIMSGSILPAIDNTYDLGSSTYQWRDIYVSSGSLYIDGTKVLGSTNQELQITTDVGQSIKILEAGSDNIILQSADGDIQLKTSGGGNLLFDPTTGLIDIRGTLQIQDGNKITSSGGNAVVFGNNIVVSGSFESTGNINGINLTILSSSIASTFSNQNSATSSYETKGRGIVSGSSQITFSGISSLPTLVSGSSQITYANISSIPSGIVSASSQVDVMSTTNITRLATTGSNTFYGTQTFSGSLYVANDLIVQGSSSIQYISASSVSIGTNIVRLNTANPSVRFAGLTIVDSGSIGGSGSFLYDSVQDEFIFVHRGNGTNVTSSHFVQGPQTYDDLGNELYLTNNRLVKGTGLEHIVDSNITDTGTLITLGSNTSVTGIVTANGFSGSLASTNGVVSGSSQVDVMSTTNIIRLATTGSNTFVGTQTISASFNVSGSSNFGGAVAINDTNMNLTNSSSLNLTSGSGIYVNSPGIISGSISGIGNVTTYSASINTQLSNLNSATSSYEIKGRNIVSGSSQITFSGISSLPTLVSGSSQITLSSTTGYGSVLNQAVLTTSAPAFAGITIGGSTSTFPVNVYTSSANTFGTIAEFYNGDFTAGARTFIRVRNQISAGSTMSSYFGQGQDGKTYIIANNSARGGDIIIDGNNGNTTFAANVLPATNGTQDLGSSSQRWSTVYTSDLSLNNGIGDWTIVEGEDDLFLYNNKKGKVYKFALTEVDPNIATPKKS